VPDTPLKVIEPEAMRGFARFAIAAYYLGIAIQGFFAFSDRSASVMAVTSPLVGSAILMWCVVDSFVRRKVFPQSLWWSCLTPLWIFPVGTYLFSTRELGAIGKLLLHGGLTLAVGGSFMALGALWL
jgi:hypothetical protein